MKKYSDDYFEKKYKILFDKLLQKEGFDADIKAIRNELGLPTNGCANGPELAFFFINKLTKDQRHSLTFIAFIRAYENEHKIRVSNENKNEVIKAFMKENKKGTDMIPMMVELGEAIETHHSLFTKYPFFENNKYLSKLNKPVFKLMKKYWGVDLLDDHIIIHYIEKYLFMGQAGVNEYIRSKISCHNCRYLGVDHFSPDRNNMDGQDKGLYSKDYLFNKHTVENY